MNIQLKNLKIHEDMSEETTCFSCTIYVDGKKTGTATNDGRGGCNIYYWFDRDLSNKLEDYAKAQITDIKFEQLDILLDNLMQKQQVLKQLKRWTKKQTLFRLKGDKKGEWRIIKDVFQQGWADAIRKKYGQQLDFIANENLDKASEL